MTENNNNNKVNTASFNEMDECMIVLDECMIVHTTPETKSVRLSTIVEMSFLGFDVIRSSMPVASCFRGLKWYRRKSV